MNEQIFCVEFGPDTDPIYERMDEIETWLDEYITNHLQYGEDFETEKQTFLNNNISVAQEK